jgi:hypothetical protein
MECGIPADSMDALAASLAALSSSLLTLSDCTLPLARSLAGAAHTVVCLALQDAIAMNAMTGKVQMMHTHAWAGRQAMSHRPIVIGKVPSHLTPGCFGQAGGVLPLEQAPSRRRASLHECKYTFYSIRRLPYNLGNAGNPLVVHRHACCQLLQRDMGHIQCETAGQREHVMGSLCCRSSD